MSPRAPRQRQPRGPPEQQTYNANKNAPAAVPTPLPLTPESARAPPTSAPETRDNTTLNLTVLRRYKPTIQSILSIASNAVLYVFTPDKQAWDKSGIEGTLFVCDCTTPAATDDMEENYCLVVFNRKGMENFILELWMVHDVEISGELLIFRYSDTGTADGGEKTRGIWMHEDSEGTRKINSDVVIGCWEEARKAKLKSAEKAAKNMVFGDDPAVLNVGRAKEKEIQTGRRISLTDLFGGN